MFMTIIPSGRRRLVVLASFLMSVTAWQAVGQTVVALEDAPGALALNPAGSRLYSVGRVRNNISVIDTASNSVVTVIPGGLLFPSDRGAGDVCVSPDGSRVYAVNAALNQVTVVDAVRNAVIASVAASVWPTTRLAVTPDGRKLYVPEGFPWTAVTAVDTRTFATKTISLLGGYTGTILIHPNGARAYVATAGGPLSVIDTTTDAVLTTISIPDSGFPPRFVISPDGSRLYSYRYQSDSVEVISTLSNAVLTSIPILPQGGWGQIAITPDGSRVYVTLSAGAVTAIDAKTSTIVGNLMTLPARPEGLLVSPDSSTVYVLATDSTRLLDVPTNSIRSTLPHISADPLPVLSPDGSRLYATADSGVAVIATKAAISGITSAASFQAGLVPGGLASLFGANLSPVAGVELPGGALSYKGVAVTVGYRPVPLLGVANVNGQEQINFQAPFDLAAPSTTHVEVNNNGSVAAADNVPVFAAQPGIFEYTLAGSSTKYAAAVKVDGSLIGPGNPVSRGGAISIFLTGMGVTLPLLQTGQFGPSNPLAITYFPPAVSIGGVGAQVLFSGYAPGFLGLYQINAVIPAAAPAGAAVNLDIVVNNVASQTSHLAVQ